jgi:hypothetical protein
VKSVVIVGTLALTLFIAMASYTSPLRPSIPELQFTYNAQAFHAIVAAWPPDGMVRFKLHFLIDFPFLLCYGALGYLISTRTRLFVRCSPRLRSTLACMLPASAAADAVENLLHVYLISATGPLPETLYVLAGAVALLKWLLGGLYVAAAAVALPTHLLRRGA